MQPQPSNESRPSGRWGWALTILILLFSLYPISLSIGSGNWLSVALLLSLDVLVVAVRIIVAHKEAGLRSRDSKEPPQEVSGR